MAENRRLDRRGARRYPVTERARELEERANG